MLRISRPLFDQLLAHLWAVYPEEGCGFQAGKEGRVTAVYPVENHLHSPVTYEMAPRAQIETMIAIEEQDLDLVAIFHSHPHSPPVPSETDIIRAYYPDALMLIVSLTAPAAPRWGIYMVRDGRVTPEILQIDPD